MPGAIQVTVLEFKGVSSSSKPSAKSLRVSMGKRQFQTWDKGEFSFPIAKLTEDLVIALLDAAGNEIARSGIRTMQIIEKGSWHEVFPINECGHVHMNLQFVLSEEDRTRIRNMRESVVKKKLKKNPNISVGLSEISGGSVEMSKGTVQMPDYEKGGEETGALTSKVEPPEHASSSDSTIDQKEERTDLEVAIPETTDGSRDAPLSPGIGIQGVEPESARAFERLPVDKIESQPSADVRSVNDEADSAKLSRSNISDSVASKSRGEPMQEHLPRRMKVPSNVRKMISAFESSQVQEVKSVKKTQSLQAQVNRSRKERLPEDDKVAKVGVSSADERTRQSGSVVSSGANPLQVSTTTAFVSVKKYSTELESSSGMGEEQSRGAGASEEASNSGTKSLALYEEECASCQSSGLWIFPDDRRHTCMTTAGEHNAKFLGHQWYEAGTCRGKEIPTESRVLEKNLISGTEGTNQKQSAEVSESGHGRVPDDSSNGLLGKVIKIAAILGFGLLVLLTRQKEPRESKSSYQEEKNAEEINNLFSISNFVETQNL